MITPADRTASLAEELAELDDVAEVYSVSGDYDLVAVVRVRHHDDLADVVTAIAALEGIVRTHTLVAFAPTAAATWTLWAIGPSSDRAAQVAPVASDDDGAAVPPALRPVADRYFHVGGARSAL